MTFTIEDIKKQLEPFFQKRNYLAPKTKKRYVSHLKNYCNFLGYSVQEFIEEANQEQISYINENNQIITPDVEQTNLKFYLDSFQEHALKSMSPSSVGSSISCIRAVYSSLGHNIQLPKKKPISIPVSSNSRLTHEKIQKALKLCNKKYVALIVLLASTGMRVGDALLLTIRDWLHAINQKNLQEALQNDENLIGYFEFYPNKTKKSNILCQTFNTPESNEYIKEYLKERMSEGDELTEDSSLFKLSVDSQSTVNKYFALRNQKLYDEEVNELEREKEAGLLTETEFEEKKNNISKFHPHALRKYFITMVGNYCENLKVAARFAGHTLPEATDQNYIRFQKEELLHHYLKVIKYLSFDEEVKITEITSEDIREFNEMKQKIIEKDSELKAELASLRRQQEELKKKYDDLDLDSFI